MRLLGWFSFFCLFFAPLIAQPKRSKYFIAIKKNEGSPLTTLEDHTTFCAPPNRFYADPILFKYQGVNYIFFEDFDYKKGVISYITVDPDLKLSQPHKVLELPIHLSFPHVFYDGGEIYMTPETYDHRSVSLFKATAFPTQWKLERVLIQGGDFADPILFKYNGYYWLFAAVREDRLRIYYARDLSGPFEPHPINQHDIRGRNAGPVYEVGNHLIRPTMDCRKGYGRSMILKEIVALDPSHFEEREIAYIEPNWAPALDGTHTYCQNEDLIVYDGRRTIFPHEDRQYSSEELSFVEGKLTGQLGNQMFVIAATVSLALDHNATPVFPGYLSDKSNNIPFYFERLFYHLNTVKPPTSSAYHEPFYHYNPIPYTKNIALHGYFQSEKYFKRHKKKILELFAPNPEIKKYLRAKYQDLLAHPNTVALHLRSYRDHDPEQKVFIQYGKSYCEKAMALFPEDALFVVFSNTMDACKQELASIQRPMLFIEEPCDYLDLYLMSMCKHNIICNSSFSWWAAYLNPNPEKVVVTPPCWYTPSSGLDDKDVVPPEWLRLKL
jgi:hypothetical protein